VAGLVFLWFAFRKYRGRVEITPTARLVGWTPSLCLFGVVAALGVDTQVEGHIGWGAVGGCAFFAVVSLVWLLFASRRAGGVDEMIEEAVEEHELPGFVSFLKHLDWKTTLFLIAIFVPVGALEAYDWVDRLADGIQYVAGGSRLAVFVILVFTAMAASAFVDNVPFLLVMLPTVATLAGNLGITGTPVFLYFGLLLGASVGGNITPVGAQANIAAMGFLRRHGEPYPLGKYMALSIPYTIAAIAAACALTYLTYGIQ
jgi:Na+/H+ antiporter NhaD/arsenite permease-like protein